jgi:hypothetical protein
VRKQSRSILAAVAFAIVMWVTAVYWGSHSEGFQFVEGTVRASREIQNRVGNVRKVTLPVFGLYREKFVGSDKWVKMMVDVEGDRDTVRMQTALQKKNGVWTITESSIGSQQVNLN